MCPSGATWYIKLYRGNISLKCYVYYSNVMSNEVRNNNNNYEQYSFHAQIMWAYQQISTVPVYTLLVCQVAPPARARYLRFQYNNI